MGQTEVRLLAKCMIDLRWLPEVNVEAAGGLLEDSQFLDVGKREGEWQGDKWN